MQIAVTPCIASKVGKTGIGVKVGIRVRVGIAVNVFCGVLVTVLVKVTVGVEGAAEAKVGVEDEIPVFVGAVVGDGAAVCVSEINAAIVAFEAVSFAWSDGVRVFNNPEASAAKAAPMQTQQAAKTTLIEIKIPRQIRRLDWVGLGIWTDISASPFYNSQPGKTRDMAMVKEQLQT